VQSSACASVRRVDLRRTGWKLRRVSAARSHECPPNQSAPNRARTPTFGRSRHARAPASGWQASHATRRTDPDHAFDREERALRGMHLRNSAGSSAGRRPAQRLRRIRSLSRRGAAPPGSERPYDRFFLGLSETEKNSKSLAPRSGATRIGEAVRSISSRSLSAGDARNRTREALARAESLLAGEADPPPRRPRHAASPSSPPDGRRGASGAGATTSERISAARADLRK